MGRNLPVERAVLRAVAKEEDVVLASLCRRCWPISALGLGPGAITMIHCRMSALGRVVGGAETVVRALLDVVGPDGTLMAYTGWQVALPDDLDGLDEGSRFGGVTRPRGGGI